MGNIQGSDQFKPKPKKTWKVYCAIDVGAINCSYGYSFEGVDYTWTKENWAENISYFASRAPSAILYDQAGIPIEFGFAAIERYMSLSAEKKNLFQFKYDELLQENSIPEDQKSYKMPAGCDTGSSESANEGIETKGHYVSDARLKTRCDIALLLAKHCKKEIDVKYSHYNRKPDEFLWAVVVPFTWEVQQKHRYKLLLKEVFRKSFEEQFQSQKYKITLVLSTDIAWLLLKKSGLDMMSGERNKSSRSDKGQKAVVLLNSGGTSTEVSIYTMKTGPKPVDVLSIPVGGRLVNELFESMLASSLMHEGTMFLKKCKEQYPDVWLDHVQTFEAVRKAFHFDKETPVTMNLNYAFTEAYRKITGKDFSEEIVQSEGWQSMWADLSDHGKLTLSGGLIRGMCTSVLDQIWNETTEFLNKHKMSLEYCGILLTGGFGESAFFREYFSAQKEVYELDSMRLYSLEHSTSLLTIGPIISAKKCNVLRHNVAVIYNDITYSSEPKIEGKLFPLLLQGQIIQIGEHFSYGPIKVDASQNGAICVKVVFMCQDEKLFNPDMVLLQPDCYYNASAYGIKDSIGKLTLFVPNSVNNRRLPLCFGVWCDCYGFEIKMALNTADNRMSVSDYFSFNATKWVNKQPQKTPEPLRW